MHFRKAGLAVPLSLATLSLLVGCVPIQPSGTTPTATAPVTQTPTPTPTPTASATPTEGSVPVTIACSALVTPQKMYNFNPNFSLLSSYSPAAGSAAAEVVKQKGVACAWINQTSGDLIVVAVAYLSQPQLTALKNNLVTSSNSVPTYGVEGYFSLAAGVGEAQAFPDPYWVVVTSKVFAEPGGAEPIVSAAITALRG